MTVGGRIKALMEKNHISQNRLAREAQISQSGLSSIVNGAVSPKEDTLTRIAAALGVAVTDLLTDEKKEPTPLGELQMQNVSLLTQLSPQEIQRVRDFAQGLIAARSVTDSPRK